MKLRRRYGRAHHGRVESVRALRARGYEYWKAQHTLESGHTDNLKYDDGRVRVWVSRMGLEDYGSRADWLADRLTIEKLVKGRWEKV